MEGDIQYYPRLNQAVIEASFQTKFITAIIGPRRAGKTWLARNYISSHSEYVWVTLNMDYMHERIRIEEGALTEMIEEGAKQLIGGEHKLWVVIDEAQKCPALFDQIKILYDKFSSADAIKFIITDSGVLDLHRLSAESLAGRIEIFRLAAFNNRESAHMEQSNLPLDSVLDRLVSNELLSSITAYRQQLSPFKTLLNEKLEAQLIWGGFPEMLVQPTIEQKQRYLNNYIDTYLEKDIRAIKEVSDLNLFRNIMEVTAECTGSLRDDSKWLKSLACSRPTLDKYRGYLQATLLQEEIFPYINSTLKRVIKSPKSYLLHNGIISVLTGINNLKILKSSGLIGHRFENWVLTELRTWLARSSSRNAIYFWRLSTGVEVDFVVVNKPYIYPIEVTFSSIPINKKINSLKNFMREEPNTTLAIYLYQGELSYDKSNNILYLPAWLI